MGVERKIPERVFVTHSKEIEGILRRAVQKALLEHKRAGNPIATWKDGKVVILQPDEIPVEDPLND
ncbi:MAG: hypothetical protein L0229_16070 [Blastocatellia bacterium]|nr:hypothetical protein [Blastocatellia bacterium]